MENRKYFAIDEFILTTLHEENSDDKVLSVFRRVIMNNIPLFFSQAVIAVNDQEPEELFDPFSDSYDLLLNGRSELLNSSIIKKIQPTVSHLRFAESRGGKISILQFQAQNKIYYSSDDTGQRLQPLCVPISRLLLERADVLKLAKVIGGKSPNDKTADRLEVAKRYFEQQRIQQKMDPKSTYQDIYEAINEPSKRALWDDFSKLDKALFQKGSMQKPAMSRISECLPIRFRIGPNAGRGEFQTLNI